jgi:hypothetical protein
MVRASRTSGAPPDWESVYPEGAVALCHRRHTGAQPGCVARSDGEHEIVEGDAEQCPTGVSAAVSLWPRRMFCAKA